MELKLEFLKRILLGCVSNEIVSKFFQNGYPDIETMNIEISKSIPSDKVDSNGDFKNSYTMIGWDRLCNVHSSLDYIRENNIDGDVMETGVWKGGTCIFMAEYIKLYKMNKNIYVADSFDGLPRPNMTDYEMGHQDIELYNEFYNSFKSGHLDDAGTSNIFDISIENVKSNFKSFRLLDDNVFFIKGWFKDTMVNNKEITKLSLLRLDGDLYSSTMDVLNNMYYKVSDKGIIIIDDYGLPRCKEAVINFREENNISNDIISIDTCGVYWYK
jgi:O-methyltransferase